MYLVNKFINVSQNNFPQKFSVNFPNFNAIMMWYFSEKVHICIYDCCRREFVLESLSY